MRRFNLATSPLGELLFTPCEDAEVLACDDTSSFAQTLVPRHPRPLGAMSRSQWYDKHSHVIERLLRSMMFDIINNIDVASDGSSIVWDSDILRSALLKFVYETSVSKWRSYHLLK